MAECEKIDILNIIEIQSIKSILIKDKRLLDMFNLLLKIANKSIKNNTELYKIIIDESESEISLDLSSSDSDDND